MAKKIKINPFFIDDRGKMYHLLIDKEKINSILLITCKRGSIRANHYHRKDTHYSYMLEGEMEYFFKNPNSNKLKKIIVKKGEMIFTPSNETHAMRFKKKSIFLALTTKQRDIINYETDTVKEDII